MKKKKSTANLLIFNIDDDPLDQEMKLKGLKICPWSYYMENLFSKDDIFIYIGVLKFYQGDYMGAIRDFKASVKFKRMYKDIENKDDEER